MQDPQDLQSWNRYSYVLNNPMSYTDPTGYFSVGDLLRTAAAVAITVYSGGTAAGASWGLFGTSVSAGQAWGAILVGGFASGAVQTGTLKGAVTGAISAGVFYGIGNAFMPSNASWAYDGKNLNMAGYAAKTLSHGLAGGVMAELQDGSFGHGFASAGFGEALSPAVQGLRSVPAEAIATAVIGGTASVLAGGKFANGAVTASFGYTFNNVFHRLGNSTPSKDMDNKQRLALIRASKQFNYWVSKLDVDQMHIAFPDLTEWDATWGSREDAADMWATRISGIMRQWQAEAIPQYIVQGGLDNIADDISGKVVGFGLSSVGKFAEAGWSIFDSVSTWGGRGSELANIGQPQVKIGCSVLRDGCVYFIGE